MWCVCRGGCRAWLGCRLVVGGRRAQGAGCRLNLLSLAVPILHPSKTSQVGTPHAAGRRQTRLRRRRRRSAPPTRLTIRRMGITRDSRHKRSASGARRAQVSKTRPGPPVYRPRLLSAIQKSTESQPRSIVDIERTARERSRELCLARDLFYGDGRDGSWRERLDWTGRKLDTKDAGRADLCPSVECMLTASKVPQEAPVRARPSARHDQARLVEAHPHRPHPWW